MVMTRTHTINLKRGRALNLKREDREEIAKMHQMMNIIEVLDTARIMQTVAAVII